MTTSYSRAIFCPNQITLSVAAALALRDGACVPTTIFYWPDRCDTAGLDGIECIPYTRWNCLIYLLKNMGGRRVEAVLPHRKLGRFVAWFSKRCASNSLIDDGLDTLRNEPRNVDPESFQEKAVFYTYGYRINLGCWLTRFSIDRVADLSRLAESSRPNIDLTNTSVLVVESPPLQRVAEELPLGSKDCMLVTHSNKNKRVLQSASAGTINGGEVALENSLREFSGEVVVGESMVAVYALLQEKPRYSLTVYLAKENADNLAPLIQLFGSRDFAKLKIC